LARAKCECIWRISDLEQRSVGRSRVTEGDEQSELALDGPTLGCYRPGPLLASNPGSILASAEDGASGENDTRYSPAKCLGCIPNDVTGDPDRRHISTSYVERQNLTMRMHMRRFTRLTNGFSKKIANHAHMVALYTVFYNFTKIHKTLRVTPAMQAGLTDRVWSMSEIVGMIEEAEMLVPAAHAN
jgi:hypothetical protein